MERTFEAMTATEDTPAVDSSVTPDIASPLDLNAIVARLNDITARLDKIESAEKQEPWHDDLAKSGSGDTDEEVDGVEPPDKKESEE